MPTIPQQETIVQYVTSSSQTAYTFAFYAPEDTDIQVYYQASNATPVPSSDILTLNVDYTVTFNADPVTGGTITLLFTPASGYYLTINRNVIATLTTSFGNAQNFNGDDLDAALDRLLLLIQQNTNYNLERNLSYVINTYLPSAQPYTQLPPLLQNYVWIGSGSGVIAALIDQVPSASVLQSQLANNAMGTDGARLVGYYDAYNSSATTVQAILAMLVPQIGSVVPPGGMLDYAGGSVPTGWLLCDGTAVSRSTYATLFAAIGTTWGVGDGSTTFNLPDFRRRVAVGSGGVATSPVFSGTTVGSTGGEEVHQQQANEVGSHAHTFGSGAQQVLGSGGGGAGTSTGADFAYFSSTDLNQLALSVVAMNVMQKGAIVTKIIKY